MICFYSSDYNALFKKGILTVLSLPKGYCVHFRYEEKDVDNGILNLPGFTNREGIIVYVKGNDPSKQDHEKTLEFLPIRRVNVRYHRKDDHTNLHHFYLELGDFVDCHMQHDPGVLAIKKFVTIGNLQVSSITMWYTKIESLIAFDTSFDKHLFFNFRLLESTESGEQSVSILYDTVEEASFFQLREGKSYVIDLSIFISESLPGEIEKYLCKMENEKKDILVTNPNIIIVGTRKDNRRYRLIAKAIDNVRSFDYLKILALRKDTSETELFETIIRFNVLRNNERAILYTLSTIANFIGTAGFTFVITKGYNLWYAALAAVLVIASGLWQYYFNNKTK